MKDCWGGIDRLLLCKVDSPDARARAKIQHPPGVFDGCTLQLASQYH